MKCDFIFSSKISQNERNLYVGNSKGKLIPEHVDTCFPAKKIMFVLPHDDGYNRDVTRLFSIGKTRWKRRTTSVRSTMLQPGFPC